MTFLQSPPGDDPVLVEGLFPATLEKVYRAWTDPAQLKVWFGPEPGSMLEAEVDLRVGGKWRFLMGASPDLRTSLHGEYLEIEPQARLRFTWHYLKESRDGSREESAPSEVTVRFCQEGAATRIHLRHEKIATRDGRLGVGRGWPACFTNLLDLLDR